MHLLGAYDWHVLWKQLFHPDHAFARALWTTVYIAIIAQTLGVLLGLVAALMRRSRYFVVRTAAAGYVLVFRGTPIIVQIFFHLTSSLTGSSELHLFPVQRRRRPADLST